MSNLSSFYATFEASVRSVGTAVTLASAGVYLHRRGFVSSEGTHMLAKISQQVTLPLFLFTKSIYCNQNWSDQPCPDIVRGLQDAWILLFWPAFVVGSGLVVGYGVVCGSETPKPQIRAVLAACGFGNSSGLPITLLTAIDANLHNRNDLGYIDPTLFLSVYLLLYPVLQWGVGSWLLAFEADDEKDNRRLEEPRLPDVESLSSTSSSPSASAIPSEAEELSLQPLSEMNGLLRGDTIGDLQQDQGTHTTTTTSPACPPCSKIVSRTFQPPVIGALLGILVAAIPYLRGLFVDLTDRDSDSPLEWFFDGLYQVGQAAVPLNMIILGCNLSSSHLTHRFQGESEGQQQQQQQQQQQLEQHLFSNKTLTGIVIGKLLIMPLIGILSTLFLKQFVLDIPKDMGGAFYLVLMIVFLTPTANNVIIMAELSGSNAAKAGIAQAIALQYAAAPFILSLTMSIAVYIASN